MLSRRSLFALLGAAAAAPMAAAAAPRAPINAVAEFQTRYIHTTYTQGFIVSQHDAAHWIDPRGMSRVSGYNAQGQPVTERLNA